MSKPPPQPANALPVMALLLCALVGGTSWLPFRELQQRGVHPLWALVLVYGVSVLCCSARQFATWRELAKAPALWLLGAAFGGMNAAFFWGVTVGDVVRVVLLFNLMPVWTAVLAWLLLSERLSGRAAVGVALALTGAAVVLWPTDGQASGLALGPWPREAGDWLGLIGGFAFAANNVLLRREQQRSAQTLMLAMFSGCVVVAALIATGLAVGFVVPWLPPWELPWLGIAALLSLWFLLGNFALQYGAARLPANTTAVVMLSEIVFAATSSAWLGAGALSAASVVGGGLIVLAAWFSTTAPPTHT